MNSLARIALVVALMVSIGGHWGMLQAIAWATMLRDYTEERGLIDGLKDTFDGEHACAMCEKIASEKQKETQKKFPLTKAGKEQLAKWHSPLSASVLPGSFWDGAMQTRGTVSPPFMGSQWDATPPVPPPEMKAC
jgi:hypothetical protein